MKIIQKILGACLLIGLTGTVSGQREREVEVLEMGAHHQVVRVALETPERVSLPAHTPPPREGEEQQYSTYTILETGMNYRDEETGEWKRSEEIIENIEGVGVARRGQQKVIFNPNLNTEGSIDLFTPDGKRLRATVLALVYYDTLTGAQVTLGVVKDSIGALLPPNQIIYEDAFENIGADVLYTWRKSGLEQDVILREKPPAPETFGMESLTTRLEVMSEFYEAPEPEKVERKFRELEDPELREAMVAPDFVDEELIFGDVRIGMGRAFYLEAAPGTAPDELENNIPVGKQWVRDGDRAVLVESVEFESIEPYIKDLPEARVRQAWLDQKDQNETMLAGMEERRMEERPLPDKLYASAGTQEEKPTLLALADVEQRPGFVLDYTTVTTTSNFTFKGNETYYITNTVNLTGTTTLEGGAVIKYKIRTSPYPRLYIQGPFVSKTSAYRPAIFTARDDDTVGAVISESDGNPNGSKFADYALRFDYSGNDVTVEHIRVSYAYFGAMFFDTNQRTQTLRHSQFYDNEYAFYGYKSSSTGGNTDVKLHNLLVHDADTYGMYSAGRIDFLGENITFRDVTNLKNSSGTSTYSLKNSLMVDVTSISSYTGDSNPDNVETTGAGSVFQAAYAGASYLADSSPYRDAGTTSIDADLLADLALRTTYPPIELTGSASSSMVLSPVGRDDDTPDLGYHYPAADYALNEIWFEGPDLTISPGTAFISVTNHAMVVNNGTVVEAQGTAEAPVHFAAYYMVQEQPVELYTTSETMINTYNNSNPPGNLFLNFTQFHVHPDFNNPLYTYADTFYVDTLTLRNSEFHNGIYDFGGDSGHTYVFDNNLFEYPAYFNISGDGQEVGLMNNLFYQGPFTLLNFGTVSDIEIFYNVFDNVEIDELWTSSVNDYNGYVGSSPDQLSGSGGNDVSPVTTFTYASDVFGHYYHSSTDFENQGDVDASDRGLAHFGTEDDGTKDTGSVDLGYHYVAVDGNGDPYDDDSDGIPDYIEDANGNGDVDSGETDWEDAEDPGLFVLK